MNIIEVIARDGILSEEEQLEFLESLDNLYPIGLIKNQTPAFQLKAILKSIEFGHGGAIIGRLDNPSDAVLIEAMEKTMGYAGTVFHYIKNPSDQLQIKYIELEGDENTLLSYVSDPSPEVLKVLIEESPDDIANVKNPSKELQQLAIKNGRFVVHSIKELDYYIQLSLLSDESEELDDIQNPCIEVLRYLATTTPAGSKALGSNILEIQMTIVQNDPTAIGLITNPLPEVIQWVKDNH